MWNINNTKLRKAWNTDNFNTLKDWWKLPVLFGEENDYGDYDYLIEEIPQDTAHWINWYCKCEDCGKYHHINHRQYNYFRTMDGYDYMDYTQCPLCYFKQKLHHYKYMAKEKIENYRSKFFAYNKFGKKLSKISCELHDKYPNKFTAKVMMFTIPY